MTEFSNNPAQCRVDFFKPSGKWYCTEEIIFQQWDNMIHEALRDAIKRSVGDRLVGMTAVCLEPYHKQAHPIMIVWDGEVKQK